MLQGKEDFNEYINYFKTFSLKEKQSIIIDQMKMLSSFTNNLCEELDIKSEILVNKELLDIKKADYTEDDFAEAVIVLVNSIQNSICDISNRLSDLADTMD